MTALVVILSVIGYLVIGVLYARSQAVGCYRRAKVKWRHERTVRESVRGRLAWRAALWPYALPYDAIRGPAVAWFTSPIESHRAHAEQLRRDAQSWRAQQYTGTPAERDMAAELARICEERAREVDL